MKHLFKYIIIVCILTSGIVNISYAQSYDKSKTIMQQDDNQSPLKYLKGDSSSIFKKKSDQPVLPGKLDFIFTPSQDSAYFKAMRLKVTTSTRFVYDMRRFEDNWEFHRSLSPGEESAMDAIRRNMDIPQQYLAPKAVDVAMYQYNLMQSQYVPYINTLNPLGLKVSFGAIGQFLGLIEDVSPVLKYKLDYPEDVEIVVYSVQASVVASIFKGQQMPGSYSITWNGRDDKGRKLPPGDYIGEVRMGKDKYFRKRIYIP